MASHEFRNMDLSNMNPEQHLESKGLLSTARTKYDEAYRSVWENLENLSALSIFLACFLVASLALNVTLLPRPRVGHVYAPASEYAGLERNLKLPYNHANEWWLAETLADVLWNNINLNPGFVALDNSFVVEKGLPPSWPFPWDNTKSFYAIKAYHDLHCLKSLRGSILEHKHGLNQTVQHGHLMHCLDSLRQETLCQADDTPLVIQAAPHEAAGVGQERKCRDFNQLELWAKQNPGCYKMPMHHGMENSTRMDRMKYCPNDSPYLPEIRKYFGYGPDWMPNP